MTRVRISSSVRLRRDEFGGIAYVSSRDDFFALDSDVFNFVTSFGREWSLMPEAAHSSIQRLAAIEILETDPPTPPAPYSGPSFVGRFRDIVSLREPLVLNCFSTAHCPLVCRYCHAADLMAAPMRTAESQKGGDSLANIVATARLVPSIVAVITGGDPFTRPDRARTLIEELGHHKALVLDSSGVTQSAVVDSMLPLLLRHGVHVRISLDSANPSVQRTARPLNRKYGTDLDPYHSALETIRVLLASGVAVTVQSVISTLNDRASELLTLRDLLLELGVRHWVLHLAVEAGDARKVEAVRAAKGGRARGILPKADVRPEVWKVIKDTVEQAQPIDIRVTDNSNTPNSVLLLGPNGILYTEGLAHRGKVVLFDPSEGRPDKVQTLFYYIDRFGHARRYLNWNAGMVDSRDLADLCIKCEPPQDKAHNVSDVVERERKYRIIDMTGLERWMVLQKLERHSDGKVTDAYFDTTERNLQSSDFVVRVRWAADEIVVALKGPRFRRLHGEYDRIELEFRTTDGLGLERELASKGLVETWRLARHRAYFSRRGGGPTICIDRLEGVGSFLEIEGPDEVLAELCHGLDNIGEVEHRNYREIVADWFQARGGDLSLLIGLDDQGPLLRRLM